MKQSLFAILFSLSVSVYSQNNIEIKLIYSRVILKSGEEGFYGRDSKYYGNTASNGFDKDVKYTLGGTKLDSLAKNALTLALEGKIKVYDPFPVYIHGTEVIFPILLSKAEIFGIGSSVDTAHYTSPNPPYHMVDSVYIKPFDPADVVAIDFYETWTINTKTMEIKKKIIAICPVMATYNKGKEFRGLLPMFWIKM